MTLGPGTALLLSIGTGTIVGTLVAVFAPPIDVPLYVFVSVSVAAVVSLTTMQWRPDPKVWVDPDWHPDGKRRDLQ